MDAPRSISNIGSHTQTTGVNGFGAGRRFDADKDRPDAEMQRRRTSGEGDGEPNKEEVELKKEVSPEVERQGPPAQPPVELGKTAPSFVYDPKNPPSLYKGQGRYFEGSA